jgi:hypothetical protein
MCRRNKVRRNKNMPKFGKTAEFGARRKNHLYGITTTTESADTAFSDSIQ